MDAERARRMVNRSRVAGGFDIVAGIAFILVVYIMWRGEEIDTTPFSVSVAFGLVMILFGVYFYNQGRKT